MTQLEQQEAGSTSADSSDHSEDSEYYRIRDAAAPDAGRAAYLKHPKMGWCPVLDVLTDIERDSVVIVLGDGETGAYAETVRTHYSEYTDIIVSESGASRLIDNYPDTKLERADHLVEDLPTDPPGAQNI